MRRVRTSLVCLGAWTLLAGCQKTDADALASIAGRLAERGHGMAEKLHQFSSLSASLEGKVRQRLATDKALADCLIDVAAADAKTIELKGTVAQADQIRRAVELAESTVGVEAVTNSLRVAP